MRPCISTSGVRRRRDMTYATPRPWEADRPLTQEDASAAISACFPTVDVRALRHLGSGWDFDAFVTRDGWVFRFPRRAECSASVDYECAVQRLVAPVLPPTVAIPQIELVAEATSAFPYRFSGYRLIAGVAADSVTSHVTPTLARDIGAALATIHGIPETTARAAGVIEMGDDDFGRQQWMERRLTLASEVRGLDPALDHAIDWVRQVSLPLPRFQGPLRFVHNDLSPDHLIVDATTGRLVGIIDWTDAVLGDEARDFVVLAAWQGWRFVDDVLRSYPHSVDHEFRERISYAARLLSVIWLAEAHEQGGDAAKHLAWVHNAFASRG
jgi:aminoglycoside phosphotransferase (APT) family kinase protein